MRNEMLKYITFFIMRQLITQYNMLMKGGDVCITKR